MKNVILITILIVVCCMAALIWKWTDEISRVLVPVNVSLDTAKYVVLKQDSFDLQGMKIKRVYYLQRR